MVENDKTSTYWLGSHSCNIFLLTESILGFIWWSTFMVLPSTIWFYPLNELEITGYEAFALMWLSPLLTFLPAVDRMVRHKHGIISLKLLVVAGVLSLHLPDTLTRLIVVTFSNGCVILWLCSVIWDRNTTRRSLSYWGLVNGFFMTLVARIYCKSLNPIWTYPEANIVVFVSGMVCVVYQLLKTSSIPEEAGTGGEDESTSTKERKDLPFFKWIPIALAFASWCFLLQLLFADVNVPSRFVLTSYPDPGPVAPLWGICVLMCLFLGVFLSERVSITSSTLWWAIASAACSLIFQAYAYPAYYSCLMLAVFLMSMQPTIFSKLYQAPKQKTLSVAMLAHIVLILASVWTVAYNFVPGGEYTRERIQYVVAVAMCFLGIGVFTSTARVGSKSERNASAIPYLQPTAYKTFLSKKFKVLMVTCLALSAVCVSRRTSELISKRRENQKGVSAKSPFTAAMWTVHFGFDNYGWSNFERAAILLKNTDASVIGLVESDCSRPYLGSTDLVMFLEERLGFYSDYGPSSKSHTWGSALLSKFPIVNSTHYLLPSPEGELAPAIHATLNISNSLVDVVVTHMGNDGDDLDRKLQAEKLSSVMDRSAHPMIFLGYVTSRPGSRDYKRLTNAGRMKDIDTTDRHRWCEYILYRDLQRLGYARVSRGHLSDTEVQMARFRLMTQANSKDNTELVTDPENIDEDCRFPTEFGMYHEGEHIEGSYRHVYHMSTPKYFVPRSI